MHTESSKALYLSPSLFFAESREVKKWIRVSYNQKGQQQDLQTNKTVNLVVKIPKAALGESKHFNSFLERLPFTRKSLYLYDSFRLRSHKNLYQFAYVNVQFMLMPTRTVACHFLKQTAKAQIQFSSCTTRKAILPFTMFCK